MDILASSLGCSENAIILREVLNVLSNLEIQAGMWKTFKNLGCNSLKIFIIFAIQYHIRNSENLLNIINTLMKMLFYRKLKLDMSVAGVELYMAEYLKKISNKETFGFPMYFDIQNFTGICMYIPWIHSSILKDIRQKATEGWKKQQNLVRSSIVNCTTLDGNFSVEKVFPSTDNLKLKEIVSNHFEIRDLTESYNNLGILINGQPGLGKTKSCDFLASEKVCREIMKIDMTSYLNYTFEDVVTGIFRRKRNHHLIVFIDELDKWLENSIQESYQSLSQQKPKNDESPKLDQPEIIIPSFESFQESYKRKFLFQLLSLLEKKHTSKSVIFIFCSNNFETIFQGVDSTHFKSLANRFIPINFKLCNKSEIIKYLTYLNSRFHGSKWEISASHLEELINRIPKDLRIPFRKLSQLHILSGYKFDSFIQALIEWATENDDLSFNLNHSDDDIVFQNFSVQTFSKDHISDGSDSALQPVDSFRIDSDESDSKDQNISTKSSENAGFPEPIKLRKFSPISSEEILPFEFDNSNICEHDKKKIFADIKNLLAKVETAPNKTERGKFALEIFRKLNTPMGVQILNKYEKLRDVCLRKITQLNNDFEGTQLSLFQKITHEIKIALKDHGLNVDEPN